MAETLLITDYIVKSAAHNKTCINKSSFSFSKLQNMKGYYK